MISSMMVGLLKVSRGVNHDTRQSRSSCSNAGCQSDTKPVMHCSRCTLLAARLFCTASLLCLFLAEHGFLIRSYLISIIKDGL